jgi:glutamate-1-semialdehyde 2,1-aminomutase/spore coat polysaccharide biosynthesis protein SpsF
LLKSIFQQEVFKRGVLSGGYHNMSCAHDDADIELTLRAYRGALAVVADALDGHDPERFLHAERVQPVFRQL